MEQVYTFVWGEVDHIERAIFIAKRIMGDIRYAHIETDEFNLDMDNIGIVIEIPPIRPQHKPREPV